jgi:Ca-activated chloride channel family protein
MFRTLIKAATIAIIPNLSMACDTALILTIDVSNSVDPGEYRLQVDGLAAALRDPEIAEAMVRQNAAIAVVQWSGKDRQELTLPWTRIRTSLDAALLADTSQLMPRAFVLSDTAPAEAIRFALPLFSQVPDCKNKVIDISGDGTPNSGSSTRDARNMAEQMGVTINGIAIESMGLAISNFYKGAVVTRNGFVITARTHREYPDAIRRKILRELSMVLG